MEHYLKTLDGFEPFDPKLSNIRSGMGRIVLAFLESGQECMAKHYNDAEQLKRDQSSARSFIKSRGLGNVKARRIGDMLVLVRDDGAA